MIWIIIAVSFAVGAAAPDQTTALIPAPLQTEDPSPTTETPTEEETETETATETATETTPETETATATEDPTAEGTESPTPDPDDAPDAPQALTVEPRQGRPRFQWADDEKAEWFRLYIATSDYSVQLLDLWLERSKVCTEAGCEAAPDINPLAGSYHLWMQAWGDNQYSIGGNTGYEGWSSTQFTLPASKPGDITAMTPTVGDNGRLTLVWDAPAAATWYNLWVGTDGPDWEPRFFDWVVADNLGCADGGVCTLSAGVEAASGEPFNLQLTSGTYVWYIRPWGPGGYNTGGLADAPGWFQGPDIVVP